MATDYYEVLGVERDATPEQIKKAYRRMAMKVHPDVTDDPKAEEKFKALNEAYVVLSDPQKRSIFDRGGDPMRNGGFGGAGFNPFGAGFQGTTFDMGDLLGAMFGATGGMRGPRPRVQRGQDDVVRMALELHEAVFGVDKRISVDTFVVCPTCTGSGAADGGEYVSCTQCHGRGQLTVVQRSFLGNIQTMQTCPNCQGYGNIIPNKCSDCSGAGRVPTSRDITVRVPAGINTGQRVRLEGQGEVGPGGGPAGDLYVEFQILPHEIFHRDGDNLEMVLRLPMASAALGTEVPIKRLEAEWDDSPREDREGTLQVPAGTQPGTRLVMKGLGVPKLRGRGRGDLGVTLLIQTPQNLTEEQRELLLQFSELREEGHTPGHPTKEERGFFSRLKDAFTG